MGWRLRKPSVPSLQDWWDREREILKRLALQHWSRARNDRCLPRSFLSALATHLKGKIDDDTISLVPVYERVFAPMAAIDLTEAEAAWVRSLVKWAEEGETSASYFFATGEEAWSWQRQFFLFLLSVVGLRARLNFVVLPGCGYLPVHRALASWAYFGEYSNLYSLRFCYYSSLVFVKTARFGYCHNYKSLLFRVTVHFLVPVLQGYP